MGSWIHNTNDSERTALVIAMSGLLTYFIFFIIGITSYYITLGISLFIIIASIEDFYIAEKIRGKERYDHIKRIP